VIGANTSIEPGARILRNTVLGSNVTVGANAVVDNSVVLGDATIAPGAVVRDAIIGADASIGPNTTIVGGTGDVVIGETLHTDVQFGGLVGDSATISGGVTIEPGTILDNGAAVTAQDTVSGTFPTRPN
jgi:glucose-1-phosphate thymidylyltransferase